MGDADAERRVVRSDSGASRIAEPRSVHTADLPRLLRELRTSLLISTYQTGHLILVRPDGATCNTHFRAFAHPMGVAVRAGEIAVGAPDSIAFWRDVPAATRRLDPPGRHDACFVPSHSHATGFADAHEMAWGADGELWWVATRFSCLATLDRDHSFRPRWMPPFVSALAPEDRCHLNGLALRDGRPAFATALAETDTTEGWRTQRRGGGVLVDVDANRVLLRGLSMPHSPRWHEGALWFLESGEGSLVRVDPETGAPRSVARLPGFARGLSFAGSLAFVGVSRMRRNTIVEGLPLADRRSPDEGDGGECGVWVVDVETGGTVAFLRFERGVEEIFAVELLAGTTCPELLEPGDPRAREVFVFPPEALGRVPVALRSDPGSGAPGAAVAPDDGFAEAYRRGLEAQLRDRWEEASSAFRECLEIRPGQPDARNDLGTLWFALGETERARDAFREVLDARPDFAQAHLNLGLALLKGGEYAEGWREFEWRWKTPACTPLECPQPLWDGSRLPDATLLVHTEQGAGDVFQFVRYVPRAAGRVGRVVFVAPTKLHSLLRGLDGVDEMRAEGPLAVDSFDVVCPLCDLPGRLGVTGPEPPERLPYLEVAGREVKGGAGERGTERATESPPEDRFEVGEERLRVGLAWAGSPTHGADRHRSVDLEVLRPILEVGGVDFVSLQLGPRRGQVEALGPELAVTDPGEDIEGWDRTAAAILGLDLVVSVDTAIAHLAGALGREVWVLLSVGCDWRWGAEGDRTPWYPTMRLFRQERPGDWGPVVERLAAALEGRRGPVKDLERT